MKESRNTVDNQVLSSIYGHKRGGLSTVYHPIYGMIIPLNLREIVPSIQAWGSECWGIPISYGGEEYEF